MPEAVPRRRSGAALRLARHLPFVLVFAFALLVGWRGLDFGWHWDEDRLLESVRGSVRSATLLPGKYNYPSVSYELTLAALLPEALAAAPAARGVLRSTLARDAKQARLAAIADSLASDVERPAFTLRARSIFLVVSLLSLLWVYLAVLAWGGSIGEALLAAALLGSSWEVGYHARWMAPDAVLMQFAALGLVPLFLARRAGPRAGSWLAVAAIASGLAIATKYQGAVLLVPVLAMAAALGRAERMPASRTLGRLAGLALLAALVFLAASPGTLLQPVRFAYDVLFELRHYHSGHGSETVAPGADHLGRILEYLALVAPSRYWPLSLLVFAAALAGEVRVLRRDRGAAAILLLAPALALLAMATLRVLFVRNLLFLLPALAILAAHGVAGLAAALGSRPLRVLPWLAAFAIVAANEAWAWSAADSIAHRSRVDHGAAISRYLAAHPRETFALSLGARAALPPAGRTPANVTTDAARATRFILLTPDVLQPYGDRFGVYTLVSGPREVNLDWYPDWRGDAHAVAVDRATAARIRFLPAGPR